MFNLGLSNLCQIQMSARVYSIRARHERLEGVGEILNNANFEVKLFFNLYQK